MKDFSRDVNYNPAPHQSMMLRETLLSYPLSYMDFLALSIPVACFLWLALHLRLGHFPNEVFQHLGSHGVTYGYLNDIAPEALSIPIIMFFAR